MTSLSVNNLENLTIMFTDIVGFSDLVAKMSREENQAFLDKHDRILNRVIKRFGGKTIKTIGDSFLVTFRSPTDAVICGMAMQDALWEANQATDTKHPILIRVALNAGEVRQTQNDVFGDAVNIAARLESITPANCIYLTEAVYLAMSKSEVCLERVDAFQFKGVSEKINVYQANYKLPEGDEQARGTERESIEAPQQNQYPYGGAHIHRKAIHKPISNRIKAVCLMVALLFTMAATWWVTRTYHSNTIPEKIQVEFAETTLSAEPMPAEDTLVETAREPTKNELEIQAEELLAAANYAELKTLLTEERQPGMETPYLRLVAGHTHTYFQRYEEALTHYEEAFIADKSLANDPLTAENLMLLLERERREASRLIAKNLNSLLILKLGERTGQPGLTGRYDAFNLLKDSGHEEAIDRVGLNIWDLRELDKCSLKKVAVVELKRLKDPRALDALKEMVKKGFFGQFKHSCLRKDAKEAIALIEKRQA